MLEIFLIVQRTRVYKEKKILVLNIDKSAQVRKMVVGGKRTCKEIAENSARWKISRNWKSDGRDDE